MQEFHFRFQSFPSRIGSFRFPFFINIATLHYNIAIFFAKEHRVWVFVEGRVSDVEGKKSRVEGKMSRVKSRGSRVRSRGSRVKGRGSSRRFRRFCLPAYLITHAIRHSL